MGRQSFGPSQEKLMEVGLLNRRPSKFTALIAILRKDNTLFDFSHFSETGHIQYIP